MSGTPIDTKVTRTVEIPEGAWRRYYNNFKIEVVLASNAQGKALLIILDEKKMNKLAFMQMHNAIIDLPKLDKTSFDIAVEKVIKQANMLGSTIAELSIGEGVVINELEVKLVGVDANKKKVILELIK